MASRTVPVTYINSAAAIKSFVGERGGTVCTSSNAAAVLEWGWQQKEKILFMPDQHLGRNTAYFRLGVPLDQMVVWDPHQPFGGLTRARSRPRASSCGRATARCTCASPPKQIALVRDEHPGVRVIVHPEVPFEVVQAADDSGSTEYILVQVRAGAPGSVWAVGTEVHLVHRLAAEVAPKGITVLSLDQLGCLCSTMFRVSPNHLLWVLEGLVDGQVHNQVEVPEHQIHWGRVALDRMLQIHWRRWVYTGSACLLRSGHSPFQYIRPLRRLLHGSCPARAAVRRCGARTAHRRADDGDPPRQAPPDLRHQPQQRAREIPS